ncbi:sensor histidine kinase [Undibacterium squillarum]|nr:ATP-binding protein [Undibacterium squillarum]
MTARTENEIRWLKMVTAGIALAVILFFCSIAHAAPVKILQAEIAEGQYSQANAATGQWQTVSLSDVWRRKTPCRDHIWTYRVPLSVFPDPQDRTLLIYRAGNRLRLLLNDQQFAEAGNFLNPDTDVSNHAMMFRLPTTEQSANATMLYIQVAGDCRRYSGLSQMLAGKFTDIAPLYQQKVDTFIWSTVAIVVVCSILCFVSLSASLLYRSFNALLFGITCGFWALRAWLWSMHELPLPYAIWFFLIDLSFGVWMSLICILAMRINQIRYRWLEAAQWISLVFFLGSSVALAFGAPPVYKALGIDLVVVAGTGALISIMIQAFRTPSPGNIAVSLAGFVMLVLGVYDHWNVWMTDAADAYQRFYFTPLIVLFFILAVGIVLNLQYMRAMRSDAQYQKVLEVEVSRQRAILEQHHQALAQQARQEAVTLERERIMKDMHDGLGSQLVSLMSLVQTAPQQKTEIEHELQEALDTLRATIDTLSPSGEDLTTILAQFRFRHESRFKRAGIQLNWRVKPFSSTAWSSNNLIQFEQMIREIFTNIIKHAGASQIWVDAGTNTEDNFLFIQDNGTGFDASARVGRGLKNLHQRASELGIRLRIDSTDGVGTTISMHWAL